ncbi:MAG: apolipoprotein N-acyltransferase [Proteobacteria bacterium]|nr:apolipoprotein N-acyltransferase [Pseudomonadota bacterium]
MLPKISYADLRIMFFSGLSGLFMSMSFPKADLNWLSWFAFIPLFYVINNIKPKKAFLAGLSFGLVHFLSLLYWIITVLNIYGYIPFALCLPILGLLTLYLALYPAFFSWFLLKFCKKPGFLILLAPPLWVCLELIRTYAFSGFPWELLGYSQHNYIKIIQIADITGVYGLSFLIMLVNCSLFSLLLFLSKKPWQGHRVTPGIALAHVAAASVLFALCLIYGDFRIKQIDQWVSKAPGLTVSVIQGNIDQSLKWTPAYQQQTILKYNRLSSLASADSPDLVIWPETAAPFYYGNDKALTHLLMQGLSSTGRDFIIGFPSFVQKQNHFDFYNSAILLDRDGAIKDTYSKVKLVPFGEYVPLQKYIPFIHKLTEQSGDFYSGQMGETLDLDKAVAGVQICFEVIFQNLSRAMVNNKATFLINITNDAWFGKSSAPYQHFSMVKFRAVENRRSVARAANTGISGFIDPSGRELSLTELYTDAYVTQTIPLLDQLTVYTRFGDWFAFLCFPMLLFAFLARDGNDRFTCEKGPVK